MLATRVRTAVLLLFPALLAVWTGGWLLTLLLGAVFLAVQYELLGFSPSIGDRRRELLAFATLAVPLLTLGRGPEAGAVAQVLLAGAFLVSEVCVVERRPHQDIDLAALGSMSLVCAYTVPLGTLLIVEAPRHPAPVLLWFLGTIIAADTGAYFTGRAFGKGLLAPRISPKKTVAGACGGLVLPCLVSLLAGSGGIIPGGGVSILLGLLTAVLAIFGDLVQSLVKRAYGVKDSGTLLPGHGGVFDRVDALLFASPVLLLLRLW